MSKLMISFDGVKYEIVFKDKSNDTNMGTIIYKKAIIEIDNSMNEDLMKQVLLHECTHLILANLGEDDLNSNEGFVERLSNSFFRMINENPILLLKGDENE